MTDCVNNSVHGTGIGKGGDYVENATANGFMPGIIKMAGATISYPDAMKEFNSITHDTYLDNYNQNDVAEGYIGVFDETTGCITVIPATNE